MLVRILTLLVVVLVANGCGDDLESTRRVEPSPNLATAAPASTSTSSSSSPSPLVSSVKPSTTIAPLTIEVPLSGNAVTCEDSVELRTSWQQDETLVSVAGDTVLQVTGGLGRRVAILSKCGEKLLVSTGSWDWNAVELGTPYLAPDGATDQMRFRWFEDPLILEEASWLQTADERYAASEILLPSEIETTLVSGRSNGLVGNSCGEMSLVSAVFAVRNGERTPWEANGVQLATGWEPGNFVASPSGDFASIEWVCTDDGSWSRLNLGRFDPQSGDLLDFRAVWGFERWSSNHRGPVGLALDDDGEIMVDVGADEAPIEVRSLCDDAVPLRDGGADWGLYVGPSGELRRQLHYCEAGRLLSAVVVDTEGTVFWAADVNRDGIDEVFVGGTSVSAGGGDAWTVQDGQIAPIITEEGVQLLLWDGYLSARSFGVFGCIEDSYAQIVVDRTGLGVEVSLSRYVVDGSTAMLVEQAVVQDLSSTYFSPDNVRTETVLPFEDELVRCI